MTYFSLRKREPEPDPEPVDESAEELAVDDEPGDEEPGEEPELLGAFLLGVQGPAVWLTARFGSGAACAVHIVAVWACFFYSGWIAVGVIALWLLAFALFIPKPCLDRVANWIERLDQGRRSAPEEAGEAPSHDVQVEVLRKLLLDLMEDGSGVHLRTVLAHLQEHGQWEGKKVSDLRTHLVRLGIPVDPKLKLAGTPTRGVRREDLEAPSPAAPQGASPDASPAV